MDDFLSPDDPRFMAEGCTILQFPRNSLLIWNFLDITDRFDSTFIFGDLNFRLDITRLHADWLIARKGEVSFCLSDACLMLDQITNKLLSSISSGRSWVRATHLQGLTKPESRFRLRSSMMFFVH